MSYERYKDYRIAPDYNGCWSVLTGEYEQVATYPSKAAAKRAIDELYHVKPIVHRMGLITYNPRLITLESIAERIGELKAELKKEEK